MNFFEGDTPEVDACLARRICHNKSAFYELFLVFLADLVVYLLVDCRDKKRHENHPGRLEDFEVTGHIFQAVIDTYCCTETDRRQDTAAGFVGMMKGKHGQYRVLIRDVHHICGGVNAGHEVILRKHYTLTCTRRARSENYFAHPARIGTEKIIRSIAVCDRLGSGGNAGVKCRKTFIAVGFDVVKADEMSDITVG